MSASPKPTVASIKQVVRFRLANQKPGTQPLGDILPAWFATEVLKPARTMDFLEPLWRDLPEPLRRTCRLKGIHRSILTIHCEYSRLESGGKRSIEKADRGNIRPRVPATAILQ